jgi:hypothetical protein
VAFRGVGFTGAWYARGYNATRQDIYGLSAGSLSYSQLPTSGGRVQATFLTSAIGGIGRQLAASMGANGTISNLVIYSTGAFSIDEIRVGTTYADVAPVPEPSILALLGTGAGAALALAWRRRNRSGKRGLPGPRRSRCSR